jgi:primosomal protein N'
MPGVIATCSKCGTRFTWDSDIQEASLCPKCGYDTVKRGKRNKCDQCGGDHLWITVGVFGPERRCLAPRRCRAKGCSMDERH